MSSEDRKRKSPTQYTPPSDQISTWTISQLQEYLEHNGIDCSECKKKSDFVELARSVSEDKDAPQAPPAKAQKTEEVKEEEEEEEEEEEDPTTKRNYYEILGVEKDAAVSEITRKYYELVSIYHPVVNSRDPEAEEKFSKIMRAYKVLSDPEKRRGYDENGHVDFDVTFNNLAHLGVKLIFGAGCFDDFFVSPIEGLNFVEMEEPSIEKVLEIIEASVEKIKARFGKRLDKYIEEGLLTSPLRKEFLFEEARKLSSAPFGGELLSLLGYAYEQVANGFRTSFLGIPAFFSRINGSLHALKSSFSVLATVGDFKNLVEMKRFDEIPTAIFPAIWELGTCVIDSTVRLACKVILDDKSVSPATKENRVKALKILGEVFSKMGARALSLQKAKKEFLENK